MKELVPPHPGGGSMAHFQSHTCLIYRAILHYSVQKCVNAPGNYVLCMSLRQHEFFLKSQCIFQQ